MKEKIEWLKGKWNNLNKQGKMFVGGVAIIIVIVLIQGVLS
jgi:cobalamin biosynthesis protein CobD/CbiB